MPAELFFIPLHRPELGDAECEAAARVIRSGWVSQGPETEAFEAEFAAHVGAAHAVAVSSGTAALELALRAAEIGAGDEVITVSHSFIATANAIRAVGAVPVFVDVEPRTLNIDAAKIETAIGPATRAILPVHQAGMPSGMAAVMALARGHRLLVIEDAACAAGSEIVVSGLWERIGKPHGDLACFSFHGRKPLTTGEGGIVTTGNADFADRLRLLRNVGMSISAHARHAAGRVEFESYQSQGMNLRLSDIAAAIGREQLKRLPDIVARRRRLARRYAELLGSDRLAMPLVESAWARSNWQSFPVRLADELDQRRVMQGMLDAGIATRRGIMCAHREPAWPVGTWICGAHRDACPGERCDALAESEAGRDRHIILPLYAGLTDADQDRVVATLQRICRQ